ncbi:TM2 domain-containing protein [Actinomyces sp.]|uniref:TM2 domain-containing protein n=1 Tax=Actinomyces sp. TaxID=29317 RepID=UPI0026DC2D0A|nr:TM2 domain-containing protein [Actinomyces sp.]MDO4900915.1 TM2 domain-containing protein [Actinomyces sp.]
MTQIPTNPDPEWPHAADYMQSADAGSQQPESGYGKPAGTGYGQTAGTPPVHGFQQQGYASSQQAYGRPGAYGAAPYAVPYGQASYAPPKSKVAAALLAFFLGGLGIHNFYRGQTRNGIIHLCLALAVIVLFFVGLVIGLTNVDPVTGDIADSATPGFVASTLAAWLVATGNRIWAFIEFIMILVSKDGSLR